jgi:hypothetical protein
MGWEQTYEQIKAAVKESGADALLGFSQVGREPRPAALAHAPMRPLAGSSCRGRLPRGRWHRGAGRRHPAQRCSAPRPAAAPAAQGATATAMFVAQLALRQQQQQDLDVPMPRLAIMISGFLPRHPE